MRKIIHNIQQNRFFEPKNRFCVIYKDKGMGV